MSIIFLATIALIFLAIRFLFFVVILRRSPTLAKSIGYFLLTVCTGIFLFFPACILLGNEVCWDLDVVTNKTVLLVASAIILLLCTWTWFKIVKDPKLESSSGKPVATLIIVLSVLIGLVVLILGTSEYWAPLVGK